MGGLACFAVALAPLAGSPSGAWEGAGPGGRPAHPNSLSASRIEIRRGEIALTIDVQVLSLAEVLPGFDDDGDGRAGEEAIESHAAAIAEYVAQHYRLTAGGGGEGAAPGDVGLRIDGSGVGGAEVGGSRPGARAIGASVPGAPPLGAPMTGAPQSGASQTGASPHSALQLGARPLAALAERRVEPAPMREGLLGELEQYVRVHLAYRADAPLRSIGVEVDLFADTSPGHRDIAVVVWNGIELDAFDLGAGEQRVIVATPAVIDRARPELARYVEGLARSVPREWDVCALAALLALGARSRRSAVWLVLAFAAASSAGALAAAAIEPGARGVRFLELAVPLAAAYAGADLLLHRERRDRVLEALVFGAVAGARLFERWRDELAREESSAAGLAGLAIAMSGAVVAAALPPIGLGARERAQIVRGAAAAGAVLGLVAFGRLALG